MGGLVLPAVLAIAAAAFLPSLRGMVSTHPPVPLADDWVYDDFFVVVENADLSSATPLTDLLWHDYWGQR
jgi:hypothetical protein